ncbi:MAG: 4-demethylwyosine synthase TYW1 [Thaumarchaeota archaeon]|nr:4-demethylwyosine synthase TYW1 [Candidatus Calditenuaceae archaeon]MDW8041725.1 4-demethylwyosine synthase TYW1 [Nitrososphaerota archaeon]
MADGAEAGLRFVKMDDLRLERYRKAGYRVIGGRRHSAVEVCRWTKSKLRGDRNCYKSVYGIDSGRCIQMTPTLDFCNFACSWCWRPFGPDRHKAHGREWDDPRTIVEEMVRAQRELLSGFGGNPKTERGYYRLAMRPAHVAISLDGEPTLYPMIADLVKEIHSRGMTTFLVTNGTMPHRLREMLDRGAIPTNLFVSVYATNPEDYVKVTKSVVPDAFERVMESLSLLEEFERRGCRTVIRLTLVKGLNMKDPEGYAEIVNLGRPNFVEFKGYAWLGQSRQRLGQSASPKFTELKEFADLVLSRLSYRPVMLDGVSVIVVAVRDQESWRRNLEVAKTISRFPGYGSR